MDDVYKMLEEDRMLAQQKHDEHHTPCHSLHVSPSLTLPVIGRDHSSAAASLPRIEPLQPTVLPYPENPQLDSSTEVCCCLFAIIFSRR